MIQLSLPIILMLSCMCLLLFTRVEAQRALEVNHDVDAHEEQEHEDHPFEWAAVFSVDKNLNYFWNAEKVDGQYASPTMKMFILNVTSASMEGIEDIEEIVEEAFLANSSAVMSGGTVGVGILYELQLDENKWISQFLLEFPQSGLYAIFTEHHPDEFEANTHYLKLSSGENAIALYVHSSADLQTASNDDSKWGDIIGATVVVWITCVVGILFVVAQVFSVGNGESESPMLYLCGKLFGAGALLSTAFSLVLLESGHLISERQGGISESSVSGNFAAMVLLGFVTPVLVDQIIHLFYLGGSWSRHSSFIVANHEVIDSPNGSSRPIEPFKATILVPSNSDDGVELGNCSDKPLAHSSELVQAQAVGGVDIKEQKDQMYKSSSFMDYFPVFHRDSVRVVSGILVGDFFHNFCDGVFIGAAMQSCSTTFGWTVAATTIYHEFTQELGDFLALTQGLKWSSRAAILWNLCSGISVILGGITVAGSNVSDYSVGMLLAFGAGNYIYVGSVELMSAIKDESVEDKEFQGVHWHRFYTRMAGILCFIVAAVGVGLVLLDHTHCSSGESGDSGHNH